STLTMTWDREIFETFPHLRSVVLHADRVKRRRLLQEEADVYIINHDGVKILLRELIDRKDINLVIIDELAVGRNPSTQLHKVLRELASQKPWVWGMTGSPTPNAPTDAWGQARMLTPERGQGRLRAPLDRRDRDRVTVAELAVGPAPGTEPHEVLRALASPKPGVWGMPGSPAPIAPPAAWGQAAPVPPRRVARSFRAF